MIDGPDSKKQPGADMQDTARMTSDEDEAQAYEPSRIEILLMTLIGLALVAFGVTFGWASETHGLTQLIMLSIGIALCIVPRRCFSAADRYDDWILATVSASGLVLIGFAVSAFAYAQLVHAFAPLSFNP